MRRGTALAVRWNAPTNDVSGLSEVRDVHGATNAPLSTAGTTSSGLGTNINVGGASEGVVTGYVFMVDNDSDRTSSPEVDRTLGIGGRHRLQRPVRESKQIDISSDDRRDHQHLQHGNEQIRLHHRDASSP